jgi:hypothetical protein
METWELEQIPRSIATVPEGSWAARLLSASRTSAVACSVVNAPAECSGDGCTREMTRRESKAPLFVARVIRGLHLRQRKHAEIGGETIESVKLGRNDARVGGVGMKRG